MAQPTQPQPANPPQSPRNPTPPPNPQPGNPQPTPARPAGPTREVLVSGKDAPAAAPPKHGNPTEQAGGVDVVNVRVGSESTVPSGLDPVLPHTGGLGAATEILNKDIKARHDKEMEKRGLVNPATMNTVSINWTGLMMVEVDGEEEDSPRSGSYTGHFRDSIRVRALTAEELDRFNPVLAQRVRRADDLVKGSGVGGGGNPMRAGEARGASSATAPSAGSGPANSNIAQQQTGVRTSRG